MTKRRKHFISGLVLVIAATVSSGVYYYNQKLLPHVHTVEENKLYRSGQPRGAGLYWLKIKGIKTVINLRKPHSDGLAEEREFCEKNGIIFYNIPIGSTYETVSKTAEAFRKIYADPQNYPILVHCSRGRERSGVMSAIYRIEENGWSNGEALYELYNLGLEPGTMLAAEDFVRTFHPGKVDSEKVPEKNYDSLNWKE